MDDNQPTCRKASGSHGAAGHATGIRGVACACTTALLLMSGEVCDGATIQWLAQTGGTGWIDLRQLTPLLFGWEK